MTEPSKHRNLPKEPASLRSVIAAMGTTPTERQLDAWYQLFRANVEQDPTAGSAWRDIERAGLERRCKGLLSVFARLVLHGGPADPVTMRTRQVRELGRRLKAKKRFGTQKASAKYEQSPWPSSMDGRTLADARRQYPNLLGRPGIDEVLAEAGGARHESDPELVMLLALKRYAGSHGVRLGMERLIALAYCAAEWIIDRMTLSRFFANPDMQAAADTALASAERLSIGPPAA